MIARKHLPLGLLPINCDFGYQRLVMRITANENIIHASSPVGLTVLRNLFGRRFFLPDPAENSLLIHSELRVLTSLASSARVVSTPSGSEAAPIAQHTALSAHPAGVRRSGTIVNPGLRASRLTPGYSPFTPPACWNATHLAGRPRAGFAQKACLELRCHVATAAMYRVVKSASFVSTMIHSA